jgi:tRNA A37 methylthiotransferase MiaB
MTEKQNKIFIAGNQVCMKRGLDAARMKHYFDKNGCVNVNQVEEADLIIALTCGFISSYVQTAVDMITELKKHRKRLIVAGCLPAMAPEKFESVFTGDYIITRDFEHFDNLFPKFRIPYKEIHDAIAPDIQVMQPFYAERLSPIAARNNISKNSGKPIILRIAEGCNNFCSYCSHPFALGPLKSKPINECLQDYSRILAEGHKSLSIHANDPGAYGIDIGSTYPDLLYRLNEITDSPNIKWNLLDLNPRWVLKYRKDMLEFLKLDRVSFIGVPIQSGSPRIIKRMRRSVPIFDVLEAMQEFKKVSPKLSMATHLIAGFPGETRKDIEMSIDIFRHTKIDVAYIFRFSPNYNTKAKNFYNRLTNKQIGEIQFEMADRISEMNVRVEIFS